MTSRLRLSDLKGIRIDNISSADADLASFLNYCTPARLNLLLVNYWANSWEGTKLKFYVDSFSEVARRTAKEVYFHCIDFSAEDLQTVVRAACNTERIVFDFCCIHLSPGLDFGADFNYNTKYLSFQGWGDTRYKEITTDWKAKPSCFSLVVDAISGSGLKASLEKLCIQNNQTLSTSKVQEELNAKGMSHITVIQEYSYPLK